MLNISHMKSNIGKYTRHYILDSTGIILHFNLIDLMNYNICNMNSKVLVGSKVRSHFP